MKKLLAVIISLFLLLSMTACNIIEPTLGSTEAPTEKPENDIPAGLHAAAVSFFTDFSAGSRIVEWSDVLQLIDDEENPFILSIRQQESYDKGHIKGAYSAAWGDGLADKVEMLPTDRKIYIYCDNGQDSAQTTALLNMLGIDAVSISLGYEDGFLKTNGYNDYISRKSNELPDAGVRFDKEVLEFVQDYLEAIPDGGSNILPASQVDMLTQWDNVNIVDIRDSDDFDEGHIEGAVNVPISEDMLEGFQGLPEGKIVLTDYDGQIAGQMVSALRALGYDAFALKFGMVLGWQPYIVLNFVSKFFDNFKGSLIVQWSEVSKIIDSDEPPFILCLQTEKEYEKEHVKGAYSAAWGEDLTEKVSMLPDDKTVYIYSDDGQTSCQAAVLLNMLGIDAQSIRGGFETISKEKGYDKYVETTVNELADAKSEFNPFLLNAIEKYLEYALDNSSYIISADDVENAIENDNFIVVDMRAEKDFEKGHINGAVNIVIDENMQSFIGKLHVDNLIIADYGGQNAHQIVAMLRMLGYEAFALDSGMNAWLDAKMPVTDE